MEIEFRRRFVLRHQYLSPNGDVEFYAEDLVDNVFWIPPYKLVNRVKAIQMVNRMNEDWEQVIRDLADLN